MLKAPFPLKWVFNCNVNSVKEFHICKKVEGILEIKVTARPPLWHTHIFREPCEKASLASLLTQQEKSIFHLLLSFTFFLYHPLTPHTPAHIHTVQYQLGNLSVGLCRPKHSVRWTLLAWSLLINQHLLMGGRDESERGGEEDTGNGWMGREPTNMGFEDQH